MEKTRLELVCEALERLHITYKTAIHCQTEESAKLVTDLAEKEGLRWVNGMKYSERGTRWEVRKEDSTYSLGEGLVHIVRFFENEGDYKVITAEEFLQLNNG